MRIKRNISYGIISLSNTKFSKLTLLEFYFISVACPWPYLVGCVALKLAIPAAQTQINSAAYSVQIKHLIHFLMTTLYYQMGVRKTGSINRDSGIEIPEALMPMIKKHNNRRAVRQQTAKGANH